MQDRWLEARGHALGAVLRCCSVEVLVRVQAINGRVLGDMSGAGAGAAAGSSCFDAHLDGRVLRRVLFGITFGLLLESLVTVQVHVGEVDGAGC